MQKISKQIDFQHTCVPILIELRSYITIICFLLNEKLTREKSEHKTVVMCFSYFMIILINYNGIIFVQTRKYLNVMNIIQYLVPTTLDVDVRL